MAAAKTPPAAPAPKVAQPTPAAAPAQASAQPQVRYVQVPQEPAGPPPPDPMKETNERQRKAIEKFQHQRAVGEVQGAEVAAERPPKAERAAPAATSTTESSGASTSAQDSAQEPTSTGGDRAKPQPRYDSDSFKAWARNNPDKAAEVLGLSKADANAYIKLQNRERKFHEEQATATSAHEAHKKALEEGQAALQKLIDEQNAQVQPVMDLVSIGQVSAKTIKERLEAVKGDFQKADFSAVDFGATDDLFEHVMGVPFDDYSRARARQGLKVSPGDRALRLELERTRKENAELKAKTASPATAPIEQPAAAPPPAAPKASDLAWVASALTEDHPARELRDWDKRILAALGTDENMTLEDAADQVLEESRAKLTPAAPARRQPAARPPATPPKRQRHTDASDLAALQAPKGNAAQVDDEGPDPIKDPDGRTRWALQRHMQRMAQR